MILRDSSVVHAIHADRLRDAAPRTRPLAPAEEPPRLGLRRSIGRGFVRFGAWLAAERADSLARPLA